MHNSLHTHEVMYQIYVTVLMGTCGSALKSLAKTQICKPRAATPALKNSMITPAGLLKVAHLYEVEITYTTCCPAQKDNIRARSGTASASRISSETTYGLNMHSLNF
jgi:hypothetical protein